MFICMPYQESVILSSPPVYTPAAGEFPGAGLKDAWQHAFRVGAAVSGAVLCQRQARKIIDRHFSSLTPENAMKFGVIHPEEDRWNWEEADRIADFARRMEIPLRGHTIIWHNQNPEWLFRDRDGGVSKNRLFRRLEDHIAAITGRYNNAVYAWDVLNEVIDVEKGSEDGFRQSEWYKTGGREIYEFAFKTMGGASPGARLFYNDYNNEQGKKLETTIRFLAELLDKGLPLHGVGIQGHWNYKYPDTLTLRDAIERYAALGLEIELTEVDISVYAPDEGAEAKSFYAKMPEDRARQQAERYRDIFRIAADYPAVKNITTWGIADNHTWLDNFPVPGRKNWPLLFDTKYRYKGVVPCLVETGLNLND
jgi:endo-1,4-beta-xylanase